MLNHGNIYYMVTKLFYSLAKKTLAEVRGAVRMDTHE